MRKVYRKIYDLRLRAKQFKPLHCPNQGKQTTFGERVHLNIFLACGDRLTKLKLLKL